MDKISMPLFVIILPLLKITTNIERNFIKNLCTILNKILRHLSSNRTEIIKAKTEKTLDIQNHVVGTALVKSDKTPPKTKAITNIRNKCEKYIRTNFNFGSVSFCKMIRIPIISMSIPRSIFSKGNILRKWLTRNSAKAAMKTNDWSLILKDNLGLNAGTIIGMHSNNTQR
ncbi:hypothetical protein ACFLX0_01050 [Chloroflexota bacterium]